MKLKQASCHFKCGLIMKILLSISIISYITFAVFNLYVIFTANEIIKGINDSSWLANRLYFIGESVYQDIKSNGQTLYWVMFLLSCILLFGALRMWIGRIWGLLFYSVSKLALIILPLWLLNGELVASGDVMLALFFLMFYSIYIYRHKFKTE